MKRRYILYAVVILLAAIVGCVAGMVVPKVLGG
jgi:hypothetical protein